MREVKIEPREGAKIMYKGKWHRFTPRTACGDMPDCAHCDWGGTHEHPLFGKMLMSAKHRSDGKCFYLKEVEND